LDATGSNRTGRASVLLDVEQEDRLNKQPTDAEYAEHVAGAGGPRRAVGRTHGLVALAASVAVVAGGLVGLNRLLSDDAPGSSSDPASNASAPSTTVVVGPLDVSGLRPGHATLRD